MDLTVSITDPTLLLGLQRALAAHNARRSVPQSEQEFLQDHVTDLCAAYVAEHLVTRMDALDFQRRFTQAERVAIRAAGQTSGEIADYLAMLDAATNVVLTDPLTVAGVQALEAQGLIEAGRADEILAL